MIRVITIPCGRQVTLGEYVRSWKILKTLPPNRLVDRWSHFPTPAGEILREISYGVHDRINKHLPWWHRGRKWAEDWQRETRQAADRINHPGLIIDWLPPWLKARYADRLRENCV